MKKQLLFLSSLLLACGLWAQTPTVIFTEEFDGSLGSFTTGTGTPVGATWKWSPSGKADSVEIDGEMIPASFWGTNTPAIGSPTSSNGAAMFNSDAYDNGGEGVDGIGNGPFPTPHTDTLTSPIVDCSEFQNVTLSFFQFARVIFDDYTFVEVSGDGGQTWTDFPINVREFSNETNAIIPSDTWTFIDVSEVAGGSSEVQVRFIWNNADYYFWLIDDVTLFESPEANLVISDFFYPVSNFGTPETQIGVDTMGFSARITNSGTTDQTDVVVKASIFEVSGGGLGDELFADSTVLSVLEAGARDSLVQVENTFAPEVPPGRYAVVYEVYSGDINDDFYPFDNVQIETFQSTEGLFSKDDGFLFEDAETPIGFVIESDYEMGNLYTMSSLAGSGFGTTSATFSAGRSTVDGPIAGNVATILIYRVKDRVDRFFNNFNTASTGSSEEDDDLILVGFGSHTFAEDHDPFVSVDVVMEDIEGNPVMLDPGARYLIVGSYQGDNNKVSHLFADDYKYPSPATGFISSLIFVDGEWGLIDTLNQNSPIMRMEIQMINDVDETPLPETAVHLFPNPTTDRVQLQLNLEESSDAVVIIADISGRILQWRNYQQVQKELLEFDVSSYPPGNYLIRLGTEIGTKTKKFIIAK